MAPFRLRFYRRVRIAPGVRLNLAKGGASVSLGGRGAWYTVSRGGRRRTTIGVPGTGVYLTRVSRVPSHDEAAGSAQQRSLGRRIVRWTLIAVAVYVLVALVVVIVGGALLSHH
jgi:hypothetical protein